MSSDEMLKPEDIVDALIELRDIRGWTNYKVAVESDLPASTVANIFKRKTMPQLDTLFQLCDGFGISPSQLFGNKEKFDKLTVKETELIKLWEKLDPKSKKTLENLMELLKIRNTT